MKSTSTLKTLAFCAFSLAFTACGGDQPAPTETAYTLEEGMIVFPEPARAAGQTDLIGFHTEPMEKVRVGFIGLGQRGFGAIKRYINLEGAEIKALCDIREESVKRAQDFIAAKTDRPAADEYFGSEDEWKKVCERDDIDLIYICTDWVAHTPMAVYAMEHGKHVAVEVPAATTVEECWQLVDTAERTRRHCIMLENCCYDFVEMTALNMAQKGLFGELVHAKGPIFTICVCSTSAKRGDKSYYNMWRLKWNKDHTGNYYATHGLGPVAQALDIYRGDKMDYLVSLSSNQFGMTAYAKEKFGEDSEYAKQNYALGDMNVTMIKTNKGKSIMIQHDVTSPRPYNRKYALSGTKGYIEKYPQPNIALEGNEAIARNYDDLSAHKFLPKEVYDELVAQYQHPITKEIGEKAKKVGGHGGMDFIMDYRLIYCLQNGLPLDMTVYDAANWSCIGELTETSVLNNSAPVKIPDFTRGAWNKEKGFKLAM